MDLNAESMRLERLSVPELQAEYAGLTGEVVLSPERWPTAAPPSKPAPTRRRSPCERPRNALSTTRLAPSR
jgi:hypothetical protein